MVPVAVVLREDTEDDEELPEKMPSGATAVFTGSSSAPGALESLGGWMPADGDAKKVLLDLLAMRCIFLF